MVALLLDTNAVLWMLDDDPQLGPRSRTRISSADSLFVSAGTFWEISIKVSRGKLSPIPDLQSTLHDLGVRTKNLENAYLKRLESLPFHHKDPFDRLIIAQALADSVPILTSDGEFAQYGVQVVDARL